MKRALRWLLGSALVVWPVRAVLALIDLVSRLASVLRTAALFRGTRPICHWSVTVKYPERIRCGTGVVIGPKSTLGAAGHIEFGDHVRLSEGVMIETAGLDFSGSPPYRHVSRPIRIGRGVWIGARAMVLAGVTIGENAVIGAGVVVSRDVPAGAVVVGQPPRVREAAEGKTLQGQA